MGLDKPKEESVFHQIGDGIGSGFKEDEYYLMQFPQMLNMSLPNPPENGNVLSSLPSGKIGKLRIHKSGKVTMKLK
jgi:hypothetical protein